MRSFAHSDPHGFLNQYAQGETGLIIDEFQYVPQLLSYIQLIVDDQKRAGYFILTGSQNFLINQAITQSLAGRVGILTLLPLSIHELAQAHALPQRYLDYIINGSYPCIYADSIAPQDAYPSYIATYIERDVRLLANVGDFHTFQTFLSLCAARVGQLVNLTELSNAAGISLPTVQRWLSLLEATYIIFRLLPHFNNFNKRLVKTPKLYFYNTGVVCSLLRITNV